MAEISKPDYTYLWSSGGSIVAPSNSKIQTGWTAEVPPFQWENWSQNRQDQAIAHVLQHGISVWDSVTEYQAAKSYVQGSNGLIYKAVTTNTNINPTTDGGTNWVVSSGSYSIASTAQAQAQTNNTVLLSALRLAEAFQGGNQTLASPGKQKLPGGLIVQWMRPAVTGPSSGQYSATAVLPQAFPNGFLSVFVSDANGPLSKVSWSGLPVTASNQNVTVSGTQLTGTTSNDPYLICLGY